MAPEGRAVLFSLGEKLTWEGFDDIDIKEISDTNNNEATTTKLEQCELFLRKLFEEQIKMKSKDVEDLAMQSGFKKRTLDEAKKLLGLSSERISNSWYYVFKKE